MIDFSGNVLALSGGVGGAKLSLGLSEVLTSDQLHIVVNTGDDFEHLGLTICPDIDTALYTLSGRANQALGWGLANESWNAMDALAQLGGQTWFRLGDRDLATHLWRTAELASGKRLDEVTCALAERLGIHCRIYPMSDEPVRTTVHCDEGNLPFQQYFVGRQCKPSVTGFTFEGIAAATANPELIKMLQTTPPATIVICPSNPFVSVDPILQLPGFWQTLRDCAATVTVVSPIVGGIAIKGPAAKMMAELGVPVTALGVAQYYCKRYPGLIDQFVIDHSDEPLAAEISALGLAVSVAPTIMKSREDKRNLARFVLTL